MEGEVVTRKGKARDGYWGGGAGVVVGEGVHMRTLRGGVSVRRDKVILTVDGG